MSSESGATTTGYDEYTYGTVDTDDDDDMTGWDTDGTGYETGDETDGDEYTYATVVEEAEPTFTANTIVQQSATSQMVMDQLGDAGPELDEGLIALSLKKLKRQPEVKAKAEEIAAIKAIQETVWNTSSSDQTWGQWISSSAVRMTLFIVVCALLVLVFSPLILVVAVCAMPFVFRDNSVNKLSYAVAVLLLLVPIGAGVNVILLITTDVSVSRTEALAPLVLYVVVSLAFGVTISMSETLGLDLTSWEGAAKFADVSDQLPLSYNAASRQLLAMKVVRELYEAMQQELGNEAATAMLPIGLAFVLSVAHVFIGPLFRHFNDDGRDFFGAERGTSPQTQDYVVFFVWAASVTVSGTVFLTLSFFSTLKLLQQVRFLGFYDDLAGNGVNDINFPGASEPLRLDLKDPTDCRVWLLLRARIRHLDRDTRSMLTAIVLISLVAFTSLSLLLVFRLLLSVKDLDELAIMSLVDAILAALILLSVTGAGVAITSTNKTDHDTLLLARIKVRKEINDINIALRTETTKLAGLDRLKRDKRLQSKKRIAIYEQLQLEYALFEELLSTRVVEAEHAEPFRVAGIPLNENLRGTILSVGASAVSAGILRVTGLA